MSVTLSELKSHLRITDAGEDVALQIYLDAALDWVETQTGQRLSNAARVDYFDYFSDLELIGDSPTSITVTYVDDDGSDQDVSSSVYALKTHKARAYLTLSFAESWPSVRSQDAAIDVAYTSGYTVSTLPSSLKSAVLILAASMYEVREEFVVGTIISKAPLTIQRLITPYVIYTL
jgi:uncharacterized phiE125 gp8 family phage protein